jgi:hypothetical protein
VTGKITRVAVTYTVDTLDGPRHTFHGLAHMRRHIRPERLSELLDDLTVICEDLLAARQPTPANGLATVREHRTQVTSEEATDLLHLQDQPGRPRRADCSDLAQALRMS